MPMKKKEEDAGEDAGKVVRGAGAARAQSAIEAQKMRASAAKKPRVYVVKSGDSLSKIAKEVYGDASRWPEIFEANKDQIKDPNLIRVGQELYI